jgi:hypothetical protein
MTILNRRNFSHIYFLVFDRIATVIPLNMIISRILIATHACATLRKRNISGIGTFVADPLMFIRVFISFNLLLNLRVILKGGLLVIEINVFLSLFIHS